jgi:hypothetical protein
MSNLAGRTIKLFLVDGVPEGIRTAEIMSWTGHVLFAPRSSITALLARPEAKKTGAYLLIGPDTNAADQTMVYVGEGDNVGVRISSHNKDPDKDFWEHVCVVTSKDLNLTKAHARYLESRLIGIIRAEGRVTLANRSDPDFNLLPESDLADMEDFIGRLQILLPVLGADFVRPTPKVRQRLDGSDVVTPSFRAKDGSTFRSEISKENPVFIMNAGGLRATAVEADGQMIILAGSEARAQETVSLASNVRAYRERLQKAGKLLPVEGKNHLTFTEDVAFTSPSAAAQAVMGTSRNGRDDWINETTNEKYAEWQDRLVAEAETQSAKLLDDQQPVQVPNEP